jgi:hypothetical protein
MRSHQRGIRKYKCHVSIRKSRYHSFCSRHTANSDSQSPYLHWETAQGWEGQCRAIERATRTATLQDASAIKVHDRVEDNFHNELRGHHINETSLSAVAQETIAASMNHFRPMAMRASTRRGVIGRILFGAARIAKLMTSYEDDQLIGDYLYANPPLHPRRTLHQSFNEYANFLRDTKKLDQDQIVYRATAKVRDTTRQGCSKWCQCPDCTAERSTMSRLLMVDQLWVFVLDESEYPRDRHPSYVPIQELTFQTLSSPASPSAGVPTLLVTRPECTLVCGIN